MLLFISILILLVSILLTIVVLVQNSKGGGLAANFSSQNQIMGVRKTTDFLEKATWTLAVVLISLSLLSVIAIPKNAGEGGGVNTKLTTDGVVQPIQTPISAPIQSEQPIEE